MHGRVKTRTTAEQNEIKKLEREKKVKSYKQAIGIVVEKRSLGIYDDEALTITAGLLLANPDIITLWNYRRETFLKLKHEEETDGYQKLLEPDLNLTEQCLRVNPKSYASWHHRVWILDNLPEPNWKKELILCTKYLELDERNFHCWNFRRIITQRSGVADLSEYEYTLEKIQANFSNYSAWHLRSKLLPKIYPDPEKKFPIIESKHKEELDLVQNAAFTDPNDQSAWFYQRWLLGLTEPKVHFMGVLVNEEEIVVSLSKSIRQNDNLKKGANIKIQINQEDINGLWTSSNLHLQSPIWIFHSDKKIMVNDVIKLTLQSESEDLDKAEVHGTSSLLKKSNFVPFFGESLSEVLVEQLSACNQLLELEPDSKWTLLTSILLMQSIDGTSYHGDIKASLKKLIEVDSFRRGYYLDLFSKLNIEYAINLQHNTDSGDNLSSWTKIDLSNCNLTCLYHMQYLFSCQDICLSCNKLTSEALSQLHCLRNCRCLDLSGNEITTLKYLPVLPKLEVLSLKNNLITEVNVEYLKKFPKLESLCLENNPIVGSDSWESMSQIFPMLKSKDN